MNDANQLAAGTLFAVDALALFLSFAVSQQAYATTGNIDVEQPWLPLAFCITAAHHSAPHTIKHVVGT